MFGYILSILAISYVSVFGKGRNNARSISPTLYFVCKSIYVEAADTCLLLHVKLSNIEYNRSFDDAAPLVSEKPPYSRYNI